MKSLLLVLVLALTACAPMSHNVFVTTGTFLGVQIAENPTTQLYEAKLGYGRAEFAFVPANTNCPASVPDVILEFRTQNIFHGGGIYQRLAVGQNAVQQAGAALLFSKDSSGSLTGLATNLVETVNKLRAMQPSR